MRIVFFGTPEEAATVLKTLLNKNFEIVGAVTQPDRPKGRGLKVEASPVKAIALEKELPVLQPEKLKDGTFAKLFASLKPDIGVVVAYGKIIPKEILEIPARGLINIHASLLPKYRGAAPIQWALLNGEEKTGVTIFKLTETLDAGDILVQDWLKIEEADNAATLGQKLFKMGAELIVKALKDIESGNATFTRQDETKVSYAPKIEKESGVLDWKTTAGKILNRIRAMNPHPGAHTFYKKKMLKIWEASRAGEKAEQHGEPGTVVELVKNNGFVVATGESDILVKEVQPAGGKKMGAWDFVIGRRLKRGEILPS